MIELVREAPPADRADRADPGTAGEASRPSPGRRVGLALIAAYQGYRAGQPSPCRYWPSCSAYAAEAVERHGLWRGGRLAVRRVLRCRPFGPHGVDPVPLEIRHRRARERR